MSCISVFLKTGRLVILSVWLLSALVFPLSKVSAKTNTQTNQAPGDCSSPANPVVAENCLPGDENWVVKKPSGAIVGFAGATSVVRGENMRFYVGTQSPTYDVFFYRIGFYGGAGGRLMDKILALPGQYQPPCMTSSKTGLYSCSNWSLSFSIDIPDNWISGVYIAKLVESGGGENYMIFVVRDDDRSADILYQQSVTTYQAYNNYGGKSIYSHNSSACQTDSEAARAVEVSFNRPYNAPMGDPSTFFRVEYAMVRWMEMNGYDVVYSTNIDTHHSGMVGAHNELLDHKIFISSGHDEYWSQEMRDAMTQARTAGVNLAFFSGNTGYWKVRLAPDPWTGEQDRVMVGYKSTESGPADPSGIPTGTWRDPEGANLPEAELIGVQYIGENDQAYFPIRVTSATSHHRLFRNTGLQNLPEGTYIDIGKALVGWEWDAPITGGRGPQNLEVLTETPVAGSILLDAGRVRKLGTGTANASIYQAPSGALVFSSGTIQWAWGLDVFEPDARIRQITYNLFYDMGVQPGSPDSGLILDGLDQVPVALATTGATTAPESSLDMTDFSLQSAGNAVGLSWKTNLPATAQAWLVDASGLIWPWKPGVDNYVYASDPSEDHQLTIGGLSPGQTYYIEAMSIDEYGRPAISQVAEVQTAPANLQTTISGQTAVLMNQVKCVAGPAYRQGRYALQKNPAQILLIAGSFLLVFGVVIRTVISRKR